MAEQQRVIWFDRLRHGRYRTGRRQERVARRDDRRSSPREGVRVPAGFATTASAFREFLEQSELQRAHRAARWPGSTSTTWPSSPASAPKSAAGSSRRHCRRRWRPRSTTAYRAPQRRQSPDVSVAVRSSATAEDMPDASFAGQQETFLKYQWPRQSSSCDKRSLRLALQRPGDRLSGRTRATRDADVALSVGVQRMVRSDQGAAGRDVHARHRIGLRPGGVHHRRRTAWAKRSCRAR